jgi:hypothetical protein
MNFPPDKFLGRKTNPMSVSFFGLDFKQIRHTPHGSFPRRIHLHDDPQEDIDDPRSVNLANLNARAFLVFLGVQDAGADLYGSVPIPEVRRAIMRARATFHQRARSFVRGSEIVHGKPRVNEDGTVTLRPVRVWIGGLDEDYLMRQLDKLEVLVGALAERGATHLGWG